MERDAFARCHPAVPFVYFAVVIVLAAVVQHPAYLVASLAAGAAYLLVVRGRRGLAVLAGLVPVFVLVAVVNPLFNTRGAHVLFEVFGRPYTLEALCFGMAVSGMLVTMLVWFACYSQVMTADKLTCLFGNLVPALSLVTVMTLRMVPSLTRKAQQISVARRCVGRGGAEGAAGVRERLGEGANVLSGLVDHALEGSVETAGSMSARGYGVGRRTTYRPYRLTRRDIVLLTVQVTLVVMILFAGIPQARFTPILAIAPVSWGFAAYCLFLLMPFVLWIEGELRWRISISNI